MELMDVYKVGGAGVAILILTLVKVPKVEIPIWKWIAKGIGKAFYGEILIRLDRLDKKIEEHILADQEETVRCCRGRILRFNDDVMRRKKIGPEHWAEILRDIDFYENYCKNHEDYVNNKAVLAIRHLKRVYSELLAKGSFADIEKYGKEKESETEN